MSNLTAPPFPLGYRIVRSILRFLFWLLSDFKAEGIENIPLSGAAMLLANHLNILDAPAIFTILPRQATVFAADKYDRRCLLYTSPSPRDRTRSRMPSSA